jgi:hypothetical protein
MLHHDSQLRIIRLNDYNTLFHFKIEFHADFESLVSKNYRLYQKHMSTMYSLNTLGDQSLVSGFASTFLLKTYDLILDINLLFHNTKYIQNHNVFDMNT